MEKPAPTERPVHDLIRRRWSSRAFSDRPVPREVLLTLLEAARWAPSCYNEQPWLYLVATSEDAEGHARAGSVLTEGNHWARRAPVLILSAARLAFARNGRPNLHAWHDVGAASENLFLEAFHQGLMMHEMAGFDRERAREAYALPEGWDPVAMIAVGYPGPADHLTEKHRQAEEAPRSRKPLHEVACGARFGEPLV